MTKTIGVIAEFNPFHSGHEYLFRKAKEETGGDGICCVMSGNFIQRGGPAVFDKWKRAESAVKGGADLVLELPSIYAAASAGDFAEGGVSVLEGLGIVDLLAFGSESGNADELRQAAEVLRMVEEEKGEEFREELAKGLSYPRARYEVFSRYFPRGEVLKGSNNILALEYIKRTKLPFLTIRRDGKGHLERAEEIRKSLYRDYPERFRGMEDTYFKLVRGAILRASSDMIEDCPSAGEGLGNRLKNRVRYAETLEDLLEQTVSKRYAETRIRRLLAELVLGIHRDMRREIKPYTRVLAYNERGAGLLRRAKKEDLITIPIIDSFGKAREEAHEGLRREIELDFLATDIYNLIQDENLYEGADMVRKPLFVDTGAS